MLIQLKVIDEDTDNEPNGDITDELYDELNDILERYETYDVYKRHPTSRIIKQIIDALDNAGWFSPSQLKKALKLGDKSEIKE